MAFRQLIRNAHLLCVGTIKSTVINLILASGARMAPEAFAVRTINVAPVGKGKDSTKALRKAIETAESMLIISIVRAVIWIPHGGFGGKRA